MKQHYTTKFLTGAFLLAATLLTKAQNIEYLNANNINVGIPIGASLFHQANTLGDGNDTLVAKFEAPKGSGIKAVYSSSIWMAGKDGNGNLHCSAQRYASKDFFDGPLDMTDNQAYRDFFSKVFKITRAQVIAFQNLQQPVSSAQIDTAILMWPAKGNLYVSSYYSVHINNTLAPFVDVDGDGYYDAVKGDYPDFCGEEAVFFVFNDVNGPVDTATGANLGVEVRGLAEVFIDNNSSLPYAKNALNNALFVRYEVENKSTVNYNDFYFSEFEDIDLGCWNNDYIGCDTARELMFGYNGNTPDINCTGTPGYENQHIAEGIKFLNNSLDAFGYINNDGSVQGDPGNADQYYNTMHGKWKDGTPYTFRGNGLNNASTNLVSHLFTGNPNNPLGWSEVYPLNGGPRLSPGDRRMHGSTGAMNFTAGEIKTFDLAFFVSYDATSNRFDIVDTLKRDADIVQAFYNNNVLPCRATHQPVGIAEQEELIAVNLFPNPANKVVTVECGQLINNIAVMDLAGNRILLQSVNNKTAIVDVSKLARGMYLLQLQVGNSTATRKVVVN